MWFPCKRAAARRLLPRRPMFCTSFDFEKNKGLFLLALITVVLNFLFHPPKLAQSCVCILHPIFFFFNLCHISK